MRKLRRIYKQVKKKEPEGDYSISYTLDIDYALAKVLVRFKWIDTFKDLIDNINFYIPEKEEKEMKIIINILTEALNKKVELTEYDYYIMRSAAIHYGVHFKNLNQWKNFFKAYKVAGNIIFRCPNLFLKRMSKKNVLKTVENLNKIENLCSKQT